ncbi:MAG TPA: 2'-5' RNA ligase family protein [Acidimicrobiales bacterium]|nr:2'-5' RNA ligase family protein [Acidimicrobiales bacterium]
MLRYFIAIEPPEDQRERIADVMREFGDPWPVPHITLKSPHGLTPDLAWLTAVRDVASRSPRQRVRLGPPGTFDQRVLYLSVEGDGLESLHLALVEAVRGAAAAAPSLAERPFVAHLTLTVARSDEPLPDYTRLWPLADLDAFDASTLTVFQRDEPHTHYRAWADLPLLG